MILDYLKKTVHNLSTITTNIRGGALQKKSLKTFKQNPWKYLNKSSFLVKLQLLKMNSYTRIFQGFAKSLV